MDGVQVYESSHEYLESLKKMIQTNVITIDFTKLDENSQTEIRSELRKAIFKRASAVYSTLQNSTNQLM